MTEHVCRFCGRAARVKDTTIGQDPLYDCGEWCMFNGEGADQ
jgi:hypothetical protein